MSRTPMIGLIALAFLGSSPLDQTVEEQGVLEGTITVSGDQRPVACAEVFIAALNIGARTSERGRFVILTVTGDSHELTVRHPCFFTVTVQVEQHPDARQPRIDVGLPIRPPPSSEHAEPLGGCRSYR